MHDWVVSTRGNVAKFKAEFENYFNLHYTLIYYVYTFFALMVDQRAKNLFLTYWDKTGKWYPYFYDNDTCFGINNQGELSLDYYHEDCDQLGNATVYNGQNSTLWVNFREAFADEIQETYQQLRSDGKITYDMLEDRFITQGSDKWSESVYNEDSEFKYVSMLKSDNDASNLVQLRGSGEEHFRYFIENRINYCDSKWYAPEYANDYVSLRIYTPVDAAGVPIPNLAVPACADITVTPYSNMYAGVRYKANGTLYQERSEHSVPVTFEAPDEIFNNTETAIYGASQLSSLGDLSPLYCGSIKAANATKLTELIVGSGVEGYSNENLWEIEVGTNKLLKKIDVRNCPRLESPLALTGCPNIEEIYATGTSITGIDLVDGGILRIAHLPATVTNLTLKNQLYIEDFTLAGYSNIKTLHIENCPSIDTWNLLNIATSLERLRLTGVDWTFDTAQDLIGLNARNLGGVNEYGYNTDKPHISGKAHIKELTGAEFAQVKAMFPYLDISYDTLTSQLIFMTWDGAAELYRTTIINGGNGIDPVTNGTISAPVRESTAQYDFTYAGWSKAKDADAIDENALLNVESDRCVYVAYSRVLRYYDVKFYTGTTLLYTQSTPYGGTAYYTGEEPQKTGVDNPQDYEFVGWDPAPINITGELKCYAKFDYLGAWARELIKGTIYGDYENDRVTSVGNYAFYNKTLITAIDFPNAESIGAYSFHGCTGLTSIYFPKVKSIGQYAFNQCSKLTKVTIPPHSMNMEFYAFGVCSSLTEVHISDLAAWVGNTVATSTTERCSTPIWNGAQLYLNGEKIVKLDPEDLPGVTSIEKCAFQSQDITSVNLPEVTYVNALAFAYCKSLTDFVFGEDADLSDKSFLNCTSIRFVKGLYKFIGTSTFEGCTGLEEVELPRFANTIYNYAFMNCTKLKRVSFGASGLKGGSFGRNNAFSNCENFNVFILRSDTLWNLGNINNFSNTPFASGGTGGVLLVPSTLVESYKTANNWSTLYGYGTNKFLAIEDYTIDGTIDGELNETKLVEVIANV